MNTNWHKCTFSASRENTSLSRIQYDSFFCAVIIDFFTFTFQPTALERLLPKMAWVITELLGKQFE